MKNTENIKKTSDDSNTLVAGIFFIYMSIIMLAVLYAVNNRDTYELVRGHTAKSEVTGEDFGTVIARAKGTDGHCEYRACNETICDWYDNSNRECSNMNKGDWIAKVENRIYKGTSLCSKTPGKFAEVGIPSQKEGAYCWCNAGKNWVNHLLLDSPSYCADNGCAGNCAHGVLYSPKFRSALLKAQKTK
jgi:hypothetical protein